MTKQEILLVMSAGQSPPLGNVWRITAKKSDFYLDHLGTDEVAHLSVHGPTEQFEQHRFHLKVDRRAARAVRTSGHFVEHGVPKKGFPFDGQQVAADAFHVARIRWTWHLQRPRYRAAALASGVPDLTPGQLGLRLSDILKPNSAWDIDLFVSYGQPYWPSAVLAPEAADARIGPLRNAAGHWLTGASAHRWLATSPSPARLEPALPGPADEPNRITCGAPDIDGVGARYWFIETITSRRVIEATAAAQGHPIVATSG